MVFLGVGRMPLSTNLLKRLVVPGAALPEVHTSPPSSRVLRGRAWGSHYLLGRPARLQRRQPAGKAAIFRS